MDPSEDSKKDSKQSPTTLGVESTTDTKPLSQAFIPPETAQEFPSPTQKTTTPDKPLSTSPEVSTEVSPPLGTTQPITPDLTKETTSTSSTPPVTGLTTAPTDKGLSDANQIISPELKKSNFPIVLIVLGIIVIIIYGIVGYLYLQNKDLENKAEENQPPLQVAQLPTSIPTPVPADTFEISGGNVSRVTAQGDETIVVSKGDYEDSGIIGFTNVNVSQDNSSICFWSLPPAPKPALYYSDIQGSSVIQVGEKFINCYWSEDGKELVYVNYAPQNEPVNIYSYDLLTQLETQLTDDSTSETIYRRYEIESYEGDLVSCNYEEIDTSATGEETIGKCQIDMASL